MIILVSVLMLVIFGGMAKSYKSLLVPSGAAKLFEPLIIFIRDDIAIPNIGHKYRRFANLLTVFFFILFLNVIGLMPFGVKCNGYYNYLFLAIFTYLITNISANKDYWKHIFLDASICSFSYAINFITNRIIRNINKTILH